MKRFLLAAALLVAPFLAPGAAKAAPPQQVVDSATLTLESMLDGGIEGNQVQSVLKRARAVLICPNIFRAGFIFGGEGGACVMVARAANGGWSNPAFFGLSSGSFGLQIGVQNAQLMMMIMNNDGLTAVMSSQAKIGADAGLTLATIGATAGGAMSAAVNADIIYFSKSQGLYGGLTVNGGALSNDRDSEQAYYGQALDARRILVDMQGNNPGANPLRAMLAKYGG